MKREVNSYTFYTKVGGPGQGGQPRGWKHVAHLRRWAKQLTVRRERRKGKAEAQSEQEN